MTPHQYWWLCGGSKNNGTWLVVRVCVSLIFRYTNWEFCLKGYRIPSGCTLLKLIPFSGKCHLLTSAHTGLCSTWSQAYVIIVIVGPHMWCRWVCPCETSAAQKLICGNRTASCSEHFSHLLRIQSTAIRQMGLNRDYLRINLSPRSVLLLFLDL